MVHAMDFSIVLPVLIPTLVTIGAVWLLFRTRAELPADRRSSEETTSSGWGWGRMMERIAVKKSEILGHLTRMINMIRSDGVPSDDEYEILQKLEALRQMVEDQQDPVDILTAITRVLGDAVFLILSQKKVIEELKQNVDRLTKEVNRLTKEVNRLTERDTTTQITVQQLQRDIAVMNVERHKDSKRFKDSVDSVYLELELLKNTVSYSEWTKLFHQVVAKKIGMKRGEMLRNFEDEKKEEVVPWSNGPTHLAVQNQLSGFSMGRNRHFSITNFDLTVRLYQKRNAQCHNENIRQLSGQELMSRINGELSALRKISEAGDLKGFQDEYNGMLQDVMKGLGQSSETLTILRPPPEPKLIPGL